MKYLRFVILFIVFIGMVIYLSTTGTKEYTENNKILKNGVVFGGTVADIKISNNHGFGILSVNVSNSTVKEFSKKLIIKGKKESAEYTWKKSAQDLSLLFQQLL